MTISIIKTFTIVSVLNYLACNPSLPGAVIVAGTILTVALIPNGN